MDQREISKSGDDPRALCYWLVCDIIDVLGCLEVLEENEIFAKEKVFQLALKKAKSLHPTAVRRLTVQCRRSTLAP
jgi:hypothetical protein